MEHTDEAILPGSLSHAPIVSYRALVCVHVFYFILFFPGPKAASMIYNPDGSQTERGIRLERETPWQPCGNLLSVLSLALSQIYCHSISDTPNKGTRPTIPCLFVKSPHLWGFQLKINFRLEWLATNKSFPLSFFPLSLTCFVVALFGGMVELQRSIFFSWNGTVKAVINCALCWHLHWVIYGSLIELKKRVVVTAGGREKGESLSLVKTLRP